MKKSISRCLLLCRQFLKLLIVWALTSSWDSLFHRLIERWEKECCRMSLWLCSLYSFQLWPLVTPSVLQEQTLRLDQCRLCGWFEFIINTQMSGFWETKYVGRTGSVSCCPPHISFVIDYLARRRHTHSGSETKTTTTALFFVLVDLKEINSYNITSLCVSCMAL